MHVVSPNNPKLILLYNSIAYKQVLLYKYRQCFIKQILIIKHTNLNS